ncbi:DNA polymerase III subunit beta [Buchnera aphidicola]|uniref:DNA polymerase III subunit beta n=1 Tax=Buchnera aphidicola TaxID=9 RepID=UPI0031B82552
MKFTITRNNLFTALQKISPLFVKNQSYPILENVLLNIKDNTLFLTSCNLEIEIIITVPVHYTYNSGSGLVSGKKLLDICRNIPNNSMLEIKKYENKINIISENSFFSLITLNSNIFPNLRNFKSTNKFSISQNVLKNMINSTHFAIANQDVRYYLNGMLLEIQKNNIRTITTDGYRMAICTISINTYILYCAIIIPKKSIIELARLLGNNQSLSKVFIGENNIQIHLENVIFTSKLISGNYPNYKQVLLNNPIKIIEIDLLLFKASLLRVSVLSHEQFKGVHLYLNNNQLEISSSNQNEEEAKEIIPLIFSKKINFEMNINVNYILDVLNVLKSKNIIFFIQKCASKLQLTDNEHSSVFYIIMPLHL